MTTVGDQRLCWWAVELGPDSPNPCNPSLAGLAHALAQTTPSAPSFHYRHHQMSTAAATIAAAKKSLQNVATTTKPAPLLHYIFEPNPKPINCCTYTSTKTFAAERDHPLHIRTQRRLRDFDPEILHWTVKCPLELSKKAVVRNWAVRRVKEALRDELGAKGWDGDGRVIGESDVGEKLGLKGALCILLNKNKRVMEASGEEVKSQCSRVLRKVLQAQGSSMGHRTMRGFRPISSRPMAEEIRNIDT